MTMRKENSPPISDLPPQRNRLLKRSSSAKNRSGAGSDRNITQELKKPVDTQIPSNVIEDLDGQKDIHSRRLVEYFVVYSCKPRIRRKTLRQVEDKKNEGANDSKGDKETSKPKPFPSKYNAKPPPKPSAAIPPRTPIIDNKHRKQIRKTGSMPSATHSMIEQGEVTPSRVRENILLESDEDNNVGLMVNLTIGDQTPLQNNAVDDDKATRQRGASENIRLPQHDSFRKGNEQELYFVPVQTARYPMKDHSDSPLNPMISHFCFPTSQNIELTTQYKMPRVHYFVLTDGRGKKMYGTCLTIYEEFKPDTISPISEEEGVVLEFLEKKNGIVYANATDGQDIEVTLKNGKKHQNVFIPKVLCLMSTWPYLHAFREYLSQLYRLATLTDQMKVPIERYIINICEEIPAPPPGSFEIRLKICSSLIRFWAPPANQPIPYVSLPFEVLFECLDTSNVMYTWYSLTLERKVLLVSSQYSLLTICAEILCSLLFPMQWSHLYIPILPRFLSPMLDAPMPYLCGISRDNLTHAIEDISDEAIVVDLDKNVITIGKRTPSNPPMPLKRKTKLEDTLRRNATEIFWNTRGLSEMDVEDEKPAAEVKKIMAKADRVWQEKIRTYDDAFNLAHAPDSQTCLNWKQKGSIDSEQSRWDIVQEAFLRFYVSLLEDHRRFLAYKPRVVNSPHSVPTNNTFHMKSFIEAQRPSFRPFLGEFCRTQLFDDFITKIMYNPGEADVIFFNQSITAKANRSKMTFKKKATPFLHSATAHKVLKTIDAVEPNAGQDDTAAIPNLLDNIYANLNKNDKCFSYESWPETFDPALFGEARAIPEIIAAEFDRIASLATRLRTNHSDSLDSDFEAGHCYPSLAVGTFTVYFLIYCDVVGREIETLRNRFNNFENTNRSPPSMVETVEFGNFSRAEMGTDRKHETGLIPDCSLSLCSSGSPSFCDESKGKTAPKIEVSGQQKIQASYLEIRDSPELEAAKLVATAHLDLAFSVLRTMSLRKLPIDADAYRSIMEACGRCGDSQRASQLLRLMRSNGLVLDSEIYSKYLLAFTISNEISPDDPIESPLGNVPDAILNNVLHETAVPTKKPTSSIFSKKNGLSRKPIYSAHSSELSFASSQGSWSAAGSMSLSTDSSLTGGSFHMNKSRFKKFKKLKKPEELRTTEQIKRHIAIGDNLLDFLYEDLKLDTSSDACAKCSLVLNEDQVMLGWKTCSFTDYTTECPQCKHRFVPRFTVTTSSPTFTGSQGPGTPLYCEFLSPWVLQKELHTVINTDDVGNILKPEWRSGTDINSTLWWNLIIAFRRHRLPITFLLQGSFKNQLIMPMPDI